MEIEEFKEKIFSLSERLYPMVMRYLGNTSDTKDAIQVIMMKIWEQRSQLHQHPNINGYVFLTARNYCLDQLKKKKPIIVSDRFVDKNRSVSDTASLEFKELKTIIHGILDKCKIKHHEILIFRDLDGLEYDEIATITGLKVPHIRVILSRVRQHVQQELQKFYQYEF